MSKHESGSSQHEPRNDGKEISIVQMPAGRYRLFSEDKERLARLAARPDREIDFANIPAMTREEYEAAAKRSIAARRAAQLQKAS